ncbi:MAG: hypothetical protein KDD44_07215 [Bdellovibrionales bacterium]|nr:hypothetical protein [Bdellovibrionales bacterium]
MRTAAHDDGGEVPHRILLDEREGNERLSRQRVAKTAQAVRLETGMNRKRTVSIRLTQSERMLTPARGGDFVDSSRGEERSMTASLPVEWQSVGPSSPF